MNLLRRKRVPVPHRRHFAEMLAMPAEERRRRLAGAEATLWIEAASRHGFVEAQVLLAQAHLDAGRQEQALGWFKVAADAGYAPALNMVGRCYERGWGVSPDPAAAAEHYRRAADQGLDWAQFNLANLLLRGLGVERDRPLAYELYSRASRQDHAKSMNMLGRFHEEGWDRPPDMARAAAWYAKAAQAGDFRGQFNLGVLLTECGRTDDALPWFERALAVGSPDFLAQASATLQASPYPALHALAKRYSAASA